MFTNYGKSEFKYTHKEIPPFTPDNLIYVGERNSLSALQRGIGSYDWLLSLWPRNRGSIPYEDLYIFTYYALLEEARFQSKEEREEIENKEAGRKWTLKPSPNDPLKPGLPLKVCPMRKTLEACVYLELLRRSIYCRGSLRCNRGMQFDRFKMCNYHVKKYMTHIVMEVCNLMVACNQIK